MRRHRDGFAYVFRNKPSPPSIRPVPETEQSIYTPLAYPFAGGGVILVENATG
jgi:hypothetical protein